MKHKIFIISQGIIILILIVILIFLYPKVSANVTGNAVKFSSSNADYIIISKNTDFSNFGLLDLSENEKLFLEPGRYYWKAVNGVIASASGEFEIDSEIGLRIDEEVVENIGNVKINITRTANGDLVGYVTLGPYETTESGKGLFTGRQENEV